MTLSAMFGKKAKEYVRFARWILVLIVVVFALRLGLSLAGVSGGGNIAALDGNYKATEWVSIKLVLLVGVLYCAIAVQTAGFGTYKHLLPLLLFQFTLAHGLVGMGIILGIVTGHDNAFTALAHCGVCGADGKNWSHAIGHMVMGPLFALVAWLPASGILFVTRRVRPGAFEGPLVVVLAKRVALAAIAVASFLLILGMMLRS